MEQQSKQPALLCEASWEVCNKIGGIYTVLSTKAKSLHNRYKDRLVFIGPDLTGPDGCPADFAPSRTLLKEWRKSLELPYGITVRVGRWKIPGRPIAVLVGFQGLYDVKNEFYGEMWRHFGVDSLHAYGDYDESCAFAHAAGIVIKHLADFYAPEAPVVAHFDEWTTAMGLLYLKWKAPRIATVFTTHATGIGRSICSNGKPLYDYLTAYNGDQMARELNMESKHSLEKAAAREASCFTTVSDVTDAEAAQLLERKADVVTPNGFEPDFVPKGKAFAERRDAARRSLLAVASSLTGKKYADDSFLVATGGRMEYRNKGLDMFLDSLDSLGREPLTRQVVAFILVPAWEKCPRADLRERLSSDLSPDSALSDPYFTHEVYNPGDDAILCRMRSLGMNNGRGHKVDVIYVPTYLKGADGIFNLSYYDLLIGFDATVFASYYEPWGYTPLESVAFGVPTITTGLSGFGRWVLDNFENTFDDCGVNVIGRTDSNYHDAVREIAESLRYLSLQTPRQAKAISAAARRTASQAEWARFMEYYDKAYALALANN